jgi:hypothetical protein
MAMWMVASVVGIQYCTDKIAVDDMVELIRFPSADDPQSFKVINRAGKMVIHSLPITT